LVEAQLTSGFIRQWHLLTRGRHCHRVVVATVPQEHHALLGAVRDLESENLSPEVCAAFDIAHAQHDMPELLDSDGSAVFRAGGRLHV
jgi:hypothetical protein